MQRWPHFSLAEFTRSDCARRHNVPNKPAPAEIAALQPRCGRAFMTSGLEN